MLNFPIDHQQVVLKQDAKNNIDNKQKSSSYEIDRDYEIKNIYFNKDNTDITKDINLWKDDLINQGIIHFKWDNKTNIFAFDFTYDIKCINGIAISINNDKKFDIRPDFKYSNNAYRQTIYSTNFGNNLSNINNIKSIQMTLYGSHINKQINIIIDKYKVTKNDFMIKKDSDLELKFQKSIIMKGERITNDYSSLRIRPLKLEQGKWNQDILSIEEDNDNIFERNLINVQSLDHLPISSYSKTNFNPVVSGTENKAYIRIEQNTYYDQNKKETIKGFGKNSNSGYIVPFEFSGVFYPNLTLQINNCQICFSWEESFDKPYFKDENGMNKIKLSFSFNHNGDENWTRISTGLILEAKDYNFDNLDDYMSWLKSKEN